MCDSAAASHENVQCLAETVRRVVCAGCLVLASAAGASADITGFDGFSGWKYNTGDAGSPPQFLTEDSVEFTTGPNNRRSVWFETAQDITAFAVTFTYRASNIAASTNRQGITFAIQNESLTALGGVGGGLGYSGVTKSAAVTIENDTGPGRTYSGFYTGGVLAGGSTDLSPVNAFTGEEIDVTIVYSGSILSVTMVQGDKVAPAKNYFVGSLASTVGSSTAWIGITGGTFNTLGSGGGARQFISDFTYTVPAPSSMSMAGAICLLAARRRGRD